MHVSMHEEESNETQIQQIALRSWLKQKAIYPGCKHLTASADIRVNLQALLAGVVMRLFPPKMPNELRAKKKLRT